MKRQLILLTGFFLLSLTISRAQDNYIQLGNDLFDKGEYEDAKLRYLAQKKQGDETGMDAKIELCDKCIRILNVANYLFSDRKEYGEAKSKYEELLALNPKDPLARNRIELCAKEIIAPLEMYRNGLDFYIETKYAEAHEWFRKAAEQGHAESQYFLGELYYFGRGVKTDHTEAAKWYRKAAEQGDAEAQYSLGFMYRKGNGVIQDYAEAFKWVRKSAEQGDADGQDLLGEMYYRGEGVTKDYAEAAKWYRKAADQGNAASQYSLGYMYENGINVTKDRAEAIKWYTKSAEQGDEDAKESLRRLSRTR